MAARSGLGPAADGGDEVGADDHDVGRDHREAERDCREPRQRNQSRDVHGFLGGSVFRSGAAPSFGRSSALPGGVPGAGGSSDSLIAVEGGFSTQVSGAPAVAGSTVTARPL